MQSNIPHKLIGNNNMHDNYSEDIVLVFKQWATTFQTK